MTETSALKPNVLVIDDELQIRRLLRACLEGNGYRVFEAATGQEGISEAAQHPPGVVLLDLGLPDMDGVSVLKRLRVRRAGRFPARRGRRWQCDSRR